MMQEQGRSLGEVNQSVDTTVRSTLVKKLLAFLGPAYLISVGYMDPGNWATDLAGGSKFGYSLIWVLLMSNLMALLLQSLSARLGLVSGKDLAQASRQNFHPIVNFTLYILAEVAIAACDLAEVLGMAIGLQLLFDIPLLWGVCISVLDTFLLLFLINYGIRKMEAFILSLVVIIGTCFLFEMFFASPDIAEVASGFIPSLPGNDALYIAIGIIGATVMPHNLYLHSSLVQTRKIDRSKEGLKRAIKFNILDSTIALNFAFLINAAILILAATAFYKNGLHEVAEIQDAHKLLEPMLGNQWAPILFAVALIAAGQSSTITGTLAGQIVMEGYLNLRIQPWIRRILTRIIAIVPALFTIIFLGEDSTGKLLILSQVILSLQLGFAIIPLIHFVSSKKMMGDFSIGTTVKLLAWLSAAIIVSLNVKLVYETLGDWISHAGNSLWIYFTIIPITVMAGLLLIYVTFAPLFSAIKTNNIRTLHDAPENLNIAQYVLNYKRIAVTVDFSPSDVKALANAIKQGSRDTTYILIHIVETAGAIVMNNEIADHETQDDKLHLNRYAKELTGNGYKIETRLGYGNPKKSIPKLINESGADLLIMGAHGHRAFKDIIFGTTLEAVRHSVNIPVIIVG